jgi:putative ABC transport system ATP-binding protein
MIALESVERTYPMPGGQACHALRGLTLSVARGEFVAILGKSGSGKSTLLNLVAGLDRADSGRVRVAGEELARLSENALAAWRGKHVGVVFQFFQLLPTLTVSENVVLAMELARHLAPRERMPRALALLDEVGLASEARKLPSSLSGGQQQRAAVARALANDPPLVIADEPTGNLDSETAADLAALFERLVAAGKTLLVVTHDSALARAAHRVVRLRDGQALEEAMAARG